jgi:hypothetical protein
LVLCAPRPVHHPARAPADMVCLCPVQHTRKLWPGLAAGGPRLCDHVPGVLGDGAGACCPPCAGCDRAEGTVVGLVPSGGLHANHLRRVCPRAHGTCRYYDIPTSTLRSLQSVRSLCHLLRWYCAQSSNDGQTGPSCAIILQVTMRRLDRLRSVKNRMVRLNTRVETVRFRWSSARMRRQPLACSWWPM